MVINFLELFQGTDPGWFLISLFSSQHLEQRLLVVCKPTANAALLEYTCVATSFKIIGEPKFKFN